MNRRTFFARALAAIGSAAAAVVVWPRGKTAPKVTIPDLRARKVWVRSTDNTTWERCAVARRGRVPVTIGGATRYVHLYDGRTPG